MFSVTSANSVVRYSVPSVFSVSSEREFNYVNVQTVAS